MDNSVFRRTSLICAFTLDENKMIKNIAHQIKDAPLQPDQILASRIRACLSAANGTETIKINAEGLVKSISEKMSEIESECNALLEIAPNIALDNKICREIFISNY